MFQRQNSDIYFGFIFFLAFDRIRVLRKSHDSGRATQTRVHCRPRTRSLRTCRLLAGDVLLLFRSVLIFVPSVSLSLSLSASISSLFCLITVRVVVMLTMITL